MDSDLFELDGPRFSPGCLDYEEARAHLLLATDSLRALYQLLIGEGYDRESALLLRLLNAGKTAKTALRFLEEAGDMPVEKLPRRTS